MAVLSHGFWTRHFGADATAIGRTVRLNGRLTDIVGVAAAGFQGTSVTVPDLWLPISTATARREMPQLVLGARLKPEVTLPQAAAEMAAIGRAVADRWPGPDRTKGLGLAPSSPLPPVLRVPIAGFLTLLTGIVSIVLVIACANVAGILLARAAARRREMAVRLAIGAGRARLVRQLLAEAVLLFALGAVAGLLIARLMTTLLIKVLPTATVPIDTALPLDWRVLLYTGTLSLVTALLSGLIPALQASRTEVVGALKAGGQAASDRLRMRSAFVVAQVAFSLVLIVGAGLFARALQRVASVDLGYDPNAVEVAALDLSLGGYTAATGPLFARELVERIQQLPSVQSASIAVGLPGMGAVEVRGGPSAPKAPVPIGDAVFEGMPSGVAPGYFSTLRIPLVAGRDFSNADSEGSTPVAIVTRAAARQLWPGQDPVGQYVVLRGFHLIPPPPTERLLVVGVSGDVGSVSPGRAPSPVVYRPLQQYYSPRVTLLARTTHGQRIGNEIRAVVEKMNPYLPIVESRALTDQASPMLTQLRVSAAVSGVVGLVGVLLASIGIYGVTAFTVTRRTREIGVRMAMGAQRADVMRMVLGHGMWLVAIGAAIGLLLAAAGSRVVVRLLFGVPPLDPLIFGAAVALFAAIGLGASYFPARRATRIDAMEALRYE
jgi:predicted permease